PRREPRPPAMIITAVSYMAARFSPQSRDRRNAAGLETCSNAPVRTARAAVGSALPSALVAVAVTVAMAVASSGCRDRGQDRPAARAGDRPGATEERALERGRRMLDRAAACEASAAAGGAPDLTACSEACELNHSNSCARAADARRAAGDADAAAALYRRSCDGGSGLGCEGAGDLPRARLHYRVHCEQGHAPSCAGLARLHALGLGGPADP